MWSPVLVSVGIKVLKTVHHPVWSWEEEIETQQCDLRRGVRGRQVMSEDPVLSSQICSPFTIGVIHFSSSSTPSAAAAPPPPRLHVFNPFFHLFWDNCPHWLLPLPLPRSPHHLFHDQLFILPLSLFIYFLPFHSVFFSHDTNTYISTEHVNI